MCLAALAYSVLSLGDLTEVGDQVIAENVNHFVVRAGSFGVRMDTVEPFRISWSSVGVVNLAASLQQSVSSSESGTCTTMNDF